MCALPSLRESSLGQTQSHATNIHREEKSDHKRKDKVKRCYASQKHFTTCCGKERLLLTSPLQRTNATKKNLLAGRGGIGVSSVEDWKQCPSWLASSREDGCRGDFQASVWKHSTVYRVQRRLASVSPRLFRWSILSDSSEGLKEHGVADSPDPETGGLGFSHRRLVLRPRSKYIRQRFTSLHLAVPAMFPLHALHGELSF